MSNLKRFMFAILLLIFADVSVVVADNGVTGTPAYIVLDYRYDSLGSNGSPETGHTLCATRCNSLSFDYADYIMADAREIKKIAAGRELEITLENPFLQGRCFCLVDEYVITPNLRNQPK